MKLTVSEAATLLASSEDRVYEWIESAELPAQKIRGQYRINRTDLLEWATEHRITVSPRAFRQQKATPSLADALRSGGAHHIVDGGDLAEVIRRVVGQLPLGSDDDREMLLQILLARDALGVTPVGDGIAIPHVRTPIILAPSEAVLAISFVTPPLELPASMSLSLRSREAGVRGEGGRRPGEGQERAHFASGSTPHPPFGHLLPARGEKAIARSTDVVDTLFLLICPTIHVHLAMLAKLAYALKDPTFREAVRRRAPAEELVKLAHQLEDEF